MAEGQGHGPELLPDILSPKVLCPTSRLQLCPSISEAGSPPLSARLLLQSPLCPSVSLTSFHVTSPLSAPVLHAFSPPLLLSLFSLSACPSHLSFFLSSALVLLSRTVWKVEKPNCRVRGQPQQWEGWTWVDYYGLSGAIVIRVQEDGGC